MKNNNSIHTWLPMVGLLLGTLALGFSSLFVLWAKAPGMVTAFYREAFACAFTALPIFFMTRKEWPLSGKHVIYAAIAGIFFAAEIALWNTSVFMTSAANATLFNNTSVLWVGLAAAFIFRESLSYKFWLGITTAFVGIVIIIGSDFLQHPKIGLGDFLAIIAATGYAVFFLATQCSREKLGVLSSFWISAFAGALFLLPVCLLSGKPLTGYPPVTYWSFLGVALVTQVGGYVAINYALGHLPATVVSSTVLLQPVITAILAAVFVGQPIVPNQIFGGVFILAGIYTVHRSRIKKPKSAPLEQEITRSLEEA
ncbi:MAG: DMT family transporter [Legionellales bacterium]|nr:DMT family transporter [Legionellales bacterium]